MLEHELQQLRESQKQYVQSFKDYRATAKRLFSKLDLIIEQRGQVVITVNGTDYNIDQMLNLYNNNTWVDCMEGKFFRSFDLTKVERIT